jgi:hypothetical protein
VSFGNRVIFSCAIVLLYSTVAAAQAQPMPATGLSQQGDGGGLSGRVLTAQGIDLYTNGNYEEARTLLVAAYERVPADRTLAYLIIVETHLGMCDGAEERTLSLNLERINAALAAHLKSRFREPNRCALPAGNALFANSDIRCNLTLKVTSDPPDAEVWGFVLGEASGQIYYGRTPLVLDELCPGKRRFNLKKFGYRQQGEMVLVSATDEDDIHLELEAYPRAAFIDRYRKYASVGVDLRLPAGELENGNRFELGSSLAVDAHLSMAVRNFWMTASVGYLPLALDGGERLNVLEGKAVLEYVLPLLRMFPFPTSNTTVLSANVGLGGSLMGWDRWGAGGLVQGGLSIFWVSIKGFYYLGTSLGNESAVRSMGGLTLGIDIYL